MNILPPSDNITGSGKAQKLANLLRYLLRFAKEPFRHLSGVAPISVKQTARGATISIDKFWVFRQFKMNNIPAFGADGTGEILEQEADGSWAVHPNEQGLYHDLRGDFLSGSGNCIAILIGDRWYPLLGGGESGFYAKITGKQEVQVGQRTIGKYQWDEVRPVYDPDSDSLSFQSFDGARSGAKAFEYQLSNANIHLAQNNIVWLRPATTGEGSVSSSSSSVTGGGGGGGSASSSSVSSSSVDDPPYVFDKGLTNESEDLRLEI